MFNIELLSLYNINYNINYEIADKDLITVFVKRWYHDTNNFYPFGCEMTIILDDVSALLHVLNVGIILNLCDKFQIRVIIVG